MVCVCVCTPHACLVPIKVRRGLWIPRDLSDRQWEASHPFLKVYSFKKQTEKKNTPSKTHTF